MSNLSIMDKSKAYRETVVIVKLAEMGFPDAFIYATLKHMRENNWFDMPSPKSVLTLHGIEGSNEEIVIEFDFVGGFAKKYPVREV